MNTVLTTLYLPVSKTALEILVGDNIWLSKKESDINPYTSDSTTDPCLNEEIDGLLMAGNFPIDLC